MDLKINLKSGDYVVIDPKVKFARHLVSDAIIKAQENGAVGKVKYVREGGVAAPYMVSFVGSFSTGGVSFDAPFSSDELLRHYPELESKLIAPEFTEEEKALIRFANNYSDQPYDFEFPYGKFLKLIAKLAQRYNIP